MKELEVYSVIGLDGFTGLVAAFYRQVPQDDLIGIGAAVACRPLPHHRANGSVHGGSRS